MKRIFIPVILLFMLAIEGVAMELLPATIKYASIFMTPHWLLLFLIMLVMYVYPNDSIIPIIYAIIFGLMIDIVYTEVLGVYMFMLAISLYIAQILNRWLQANFLMTLLISMVSLIVIEVGILTIYAAIGLITVSISDFTVYRLLPTVLANLLFIILIYYPGKRMLLWVNDDGGIL